jgi:hypothetical protein
LEKIIQNAKTQKPHENKVILNMKYSNTTLIVLLISCVYSLEGTISSPGKCYN